MIRFHFGDYVINVEPNADLDVRDVDSRFHFSGTPGGLVKMLDQAGTDNYLIFNEKEALREQNDRLRAQLVAAGKACEEAATKLMEKDAKIAELERRIDRYRELDRLSLEFKKEYTTQLMAKDAEIERHKSENRRLLDKNECLRKSREGAATDANQYLNEIERLRKELAALLDAACVNRYESMAIKDTFSKAIDRAATALSR